MLTINHVSQILKTSEIIHVENLSISSRLFLIPLYWIVGIYITQETMDKIIMYRQ